jgi:hypothetical protein
MTSDSPPPLAPPDAPEAVRAQNAIARARFWEKFGFGKLETDWRSQPPMVAKVTGMRGAEGFVLDNGQTWEGQEHIPFEIIGQVVTIEARPMGAYALKLNADTVTVRVQRIR